VNKCIEIVRYFDLSTQPDPKHKWVHCAIGSLSKTTVKRNSKKYDFHYVFETSRRQPLPKSICNHENQDPRLSESEKADDSKATKTCVFFSPRRMLNGFPVACVASSPRERGYNTDNRPISISDFKAFFERTLVYLQTIELMLDTKYSTASNFRWSDE
jgi:hypothetical protein